MTSISPSSRTEPGSSTKTMSPAASMPMQNRLSSRHSGLMGATKLGMGVFRSSRHIVCRSFLNGIEQLGQGEQSCAAKQVATAVALAEKVPVGGRKPDASMRLDVGEMPLDFVSGPTWQLAHDGVTCLFSQGDESSERLAPPSGCLLHAPNVCRTARLSKKVASDVRVDVRRGKRENYLPPAGGGMGMPGIPPGIGGFGGFLSSSPSFFSAFLNLSASATAQSDAHDPMMYSVSLPSFLA